jgi:hypothetical protein
LIEKRGERSFEIGGHVLRSKNLNLMFREAASEWTSLRCNIPSKVCSVQCVLAFLDDGRCRR